MNEKVVEVVTNEIEKINQDIEYFKKIIEILKSKDIKNVHRKEVSE